MRLCVWPSAHYLGCCRPGQRRSRSTPTSLGILNTQGPGHLTRLCPLQAKHLASQYWGSSRPAAVRRDPSLPYLEQYRIDVNQFQELFASLTPWACGSHTPVLAGRMFRLLDENKDSLINFKEFVTGMSEWLQGLQGLSIPTPLLRKPPDASPGQSSHCSEPRVAWSP